LLDLAFLKTLSLIIFPYLGGLALFLVVGLGGFLGFVSYMLALSAVSIVVAIRFDKHAREGAFDDRLSTETMEKALEQIVQTFNRNSAAVKKRE